MKFLIIRFSSIGDIVLTTPVVRCLKKQLLTAEVHYLTKKAFRPILAANPYIDRIHILEDDLAALIETLRKEDYDYIIDLHHNLRTWKVRRALGKKTFAFDKLNVEKWLLTNFKIHRMPDRHIVDRYMDTVQAFGVRNDGAGLDYFIPPEEELKPRDIPTSHQAGFVGLVIGAAYATKRLPLHKLETLCRQATQPLILLGGPEDAATARHLAAIDPAKIYNACGQFSLNESAGLVRLARLIMTHDTGLMHIAAAFKRPIVSIWGNTVPEFGMYPYYGENFLYHSRQKGGGLFGELPYTIMEVKGLSCRPCSKIGYKKCPRGHFKCMELQSVERIAGQDGP
ncbi:MAG TPA: glycosyltransferase family 9 protein [Puia sp.]|jgi:ADP-heptose:LPS heptosyltransferase|nr:glycosyltransferase family 9 protein [Puia sp.]